MNGTGPLGYGPGTGWGLGPCGAGMAQQRGFNQGLNRGRFGGYGLNQPKITKKQEIDVLTDEAEVLENELKAVKEQIAKLKAQK